MSLGWFGHACGRVPWTLAALLAPGKTRLDGARPRAGKGWRGGLAAIASSIVMVVLGVAGAGSAVAAEPGIAARPTAGTGARHEAPGASLYGVPPAGVMPALPAERSGPDPALQLTADELAWLRAHPRPRVFTKVEWAPIDLYAYEGRFRGLSGDYLALIGQRLGLSFDFQPMATLADSLQALREGRADILPSISRTPQRERFMDFSRAYLEVPNVYVARRGEGQVGPSHAMAGLRIAVERGYAVADLMRERHPGARQVEFVDSAAALRGVSAGDADVYVGALPTTSFLVERLLLTNLEVREPSLSELDSLHFGVRRGEDLLRSILDKALASITLAERQEIHRRWAPLRSLLAEPSPPLEVSSDDLALLRRMPALRIGYEADFRPYTFVGDDGRPAGMAYDYLRLVADKLGLPIARPTPGTWVQVFEQARRGEVDMLVAVARNEEREREFIFIGPWMSTPNVLITPRDAAPVLSLSQFGSRPVAVLRAGQTAYLMRKLHPGVPLLEVDTRDELLASVTNGQAAGAFVNAALAAPRLGQGLGATLKMAGFFPELNSDLYFAVRRDQPDLARLLSRALGTVNESERAAIAARWAVLTLADDPETQTRQLLHNLLPIVVVLVVALLVSLLWAMRLRREVQRRRDIEVALEAERDRAQRLAQSRREFLDEASHEIRTPVNAVVGALSQLQSQRLPPDVRELTGLARRAAQTLSQYINNLLDLSRADAGALHLVEQPESLAATVRSAVEAIEPMSSARGLRVRLEVDPALAPALVIDAFRVHQVVLNLLSNAVRFSDQGSVDVTVRRLADEGARQQVEIAVADQGTGISPQDLARLFERFNQAGDSLLHRQGGSGLGLALCRRLVQAMGGTIVLEANQPRGTCARVQLDLAVAPMLAPPVPMPDALLAPPALDAQAVGGRTSTSMPEGAEPRDACPAETEPAAAPGLATLVVDDDRVQQILLESMLRQAGCRVDVADSAEAAQLHWQQRRHPLVLTDLQLPGRSGIDFARWLRAQDGGDAVRLIATSADLSSAAEARAAGIERLLHKPVAPALIRGLLRSLGLPVEQPGGGPGHEHAAGTRPPADIGSS